MLSHNILKESKCTWQIGLRNTESNLLTNGISQLNANFFQDVEGCIERKLNVCALPNAPWMHLMCMRYAMPAVEQSRLTGSFIITDGDLYQPRALRASWHQGRHKGSKISTAKPRVHCKCQKCTAAMAAATHAQKWLAMQEIV